MLDPVTCDVEREHRHGDAILLSHQTGPNVDSTLQNRQVRCPVGDIKDGVRDLLAAVADSRGVTVEEANQGVDVLGFPCLLEVPDNVGLLDRRSRGSLRCANTTAG